MFKKSEIEIFFISISSCSPKRQFRELRHFAKSLWLWSSPSQWCGLGSSCVGLQACISLTIKASKGFSSFFTQKVSKDAKSLLNYLYGDAGKNHRLWDNFWRNDRKIANRTSFSGLKNIFQSIGVVSVFLCSRLSHCLVCFTDMWKKKTQLVLTCLCVLKSFTCM